MEKYLTEVFDNEISVSDFSFPIGTPVYLKDGYNLEKISWNDISFIMVTPIYDEMRLPTIKKHYYQIKEKLGQNCAMNLSQLTQLQRNNLIKEKIPFVSGKNQIYLPFWGCVFSEKYNKKRTIPAKMSPTTQLIFLWLIYSSKEKHKINMSSAVSKLGIPKTSVSRAFLELAEYGLIKQVRDGNTKWIELALDAPSALNTAMTYMDSPVGKYIYLKRIPQDVSYKIGGLRAMPDIYTDERDGSIVLSRMETNKLSKNDFTDKRYFDDFGGVQAEVWKYNPEILSSNRNVDDISLILSLQDNEDERVKKGLDEIKEKYGVII